MSNSKSAVAKLTNAENFTALTLLTDADDFAKSPQGYNKRSEALIAQLAVSTDPKVRAAVASHPLLRDKTVKAMYGVETDKKIKDILEPRVIACSGKKSAKADLIIQAQDKQIADLRAQLTKAGINMDTEVKVTK